MRRFARAYETADIESLVELFTDGRLHVEVAHTGLQLSGEEVEPALMETLRARLSGLYGAAAGLRLTQTAQGLIATIEVPRENPRDHR